MSITIEDFFAQHNACTDGREWAIATGCQNMAELWERDDMRPDLRVWIGTRRGVLDDKALRLFSCFCARQVWHLLTDERSRHAVEVAERYAHGDATDEELAAAREAGEDARVAARVAAREDAGAAWAARAAAVAALAEGQAAWAVWTVWNARNAARRAAEEDARAATWDAAWAAGAAMASWAAEAAQSEYLRNLQPNFSKGS